MESLNDSVKKLYAILTPDQQRIADQYLPPIIPWDGGCIISAGLPLDLSVGMCTERVALRAHHTRTSVQYMKVKNEKVQ